MAKSALRIHETCTEKRHLKALSNVFVHRLPRSHMYSKIFLGILTHFEKLFLDSFAVRYIVKDFFFFTRFSGIWLVIYFIISNCMKFLKTLTLWSKWKEFSLLRSWISSINRQVLFFYVKDMFQINDLY